MPRRINQQQVRLYPYKMGSQGASHLAEALRDGGVRAFKVYPDRNYQPRQRHTIINWGSGQHPRWLGRYQRMLNMPDAVNVASNKLTAFQAMKDAGVTTPEFTADRGVANGWLQEGSTVVCRSLLRGSAGRGITLVTPDMGELPNVPLYVRYVKKSAEYRIHVFSGEVIDTQQKRKRRDLENEQVNYQIRNHDNGWVFCRDAIDIPNPAVHREAIAAVAALGLDFGAVDVIWNAHHSTAYVLEVNTAPGLEGTTLTKYVNKIKELAA